MRAQVFERHEHCCFDQALVGLAVHRHALLLLQGLSRSLHPFLVGGVSPAQPAHGRAGAQEVVRVRIVRYPVIQEDVRRGALHAVDELVEIDAHANNFYPQILAPLG